MTNQEAARELYARTLTEKFALGAFNIDNQETLKAIAGAAAMKAVAAKEERETNNRLAIAAMIPAQGALRHG